MTIHDFLRERRQAANLSQAQIARSLDLSQAQISRWEKDELPRLTHLSRLASLLGFDIGEAARLVQPEAEPSEPAA